MMLLSTGVLMAPCLANMIGLQRAWKSDDLGGTVTLAAQVAIGCTRKPYWRTIIIQ